MPPLDDEELDKIWRSAQRFYKKIAESPDYIPPQQYGAGIPSQWEEPIPFSRFTMAQFPTDALPDDIADYVNAVAESTQTPVDMAGAVALSPLIIQDGLPVVNSPEVSSALVVAGIILLISLIEMFLMLRSSFLSRIKEVGTLRAIGLKKKDIYRMFAGEIIVITLITAIPGIAIMCYVLHNLVKITYYLEGMYMINPMIALISLAIVLAFNLIAGLIPVYVTMRKTPAQILARTDI